jgi:hypothetical protein
MRYKYWLVVFLAIVLAVEITASPLFLLAVFNITAPFIDRALRWITVTAAAKISDVGPLYVGLAFGMFGYALRTWLLPVYATIEMLFGTYGAGIALSLLYTPEKLPSQFQALTEASTRYPLYVGLGSAIYVIV